MGCVGSPVIYAIHMAQAQQLLRADLFGRGLRSWCERLSRDFSFRTVRATSLRRLLQRLPPQLATSSLPAEHTDGLRDELARLRALCASLLCDVPRPGAQVMG